MLHTDDHTRSSVQLQLHLSVPLLLASSNLKVPSECVTKVWTTSSRRTRADFCSFSLEISLQKNTKQALTKDRNFIWCVVHSWRFISFTTRSDFSQIHLFGTRTDSNLMATLCWARTEQIFFWSRQICFSFVLLWTLSLILTHTHTHTLPEKAFCYFWKTGQNIP